MEKSGLKEIVLAYLDQGLSLAEIQDRLMAEHGESVTFLELRLLAAELEGVDWSKGEEPEPDKQSEATAVDAKEEAGGRTTVEVSQIAKPGVALSGSVKFASGASAEWVLDQYGRLAFEKQEGTPTQQDLLEFQEELQGKLGGPR